MLKFISFSKRNAVRKLIFLCFSMKYLDVYFLDVNLHATLIFFTRVVSKLRMPLNFTIKDNKTCEKFFHQQITYSCSQTWNLNTNCRANIYDNSATREKLQNLVIFFDGLKPLVANFLLFVLHRFEKV